jgi:hypothetical protein
MRQYVTIRIPYVPPAFQTEWHPTERKGVLSTLTRGNFATEGEAIEWAREHLKGAPYALMTVSY